MEVTLRPWRPEDREALMDVMNRVDRRFLSDRLPSPYTRQDADAWLGRVLDCDGRDGLFRAVTMDGTVVGMISLDKKQDVCRLDSELSYALLPEEQGKGIMSQGVEQFCALAFRQLEILRITGEVYAHNQASRRVLEKNGFQREGTLRQAICKGGKIQDLCVYGKLKDPAV